MKLMYNLLLVKEEPPQGGRPPRLAKLEARVSVDDLQELFAMLLETLSSPDFNSPRLVTVCLTATHLLPGGSDGSTDKPSSVAEATLAN